MAEKKTYTIEELNQLIIAADRLIEYYVNKAALENGRSPEASRYLVIKEKLLEKTEKILSELSL